MSPRRTLLSAPFAVLLLLLLHCCLFDVVALTRLSLQPQGSAKTPTDKKKIAVLGGGGYLGAVTFGFLQRAASLYGTGIGDKRVIGATADTAVRMNRILGKNFCLAVADESFIKLTDLASIDAITDRLKGWDALIFGTDLKFQTRSVTANTYEKTPNDKAWEVYWDEPKGAFVDLSSPSEVEETILTNVLAAAKQAGIQHMVVVDNGSWKSQVDGTGVPHTTIHVPATLTETPNYTFKDGIQGDLVISSDAEAELTGTLCREDLAALCVQCLMSLSWEKSRTLSVSCTEPAVVDASSPKKRPDQQWCVNSFLLEEKLSSIA